MSMSAIILEDRFSTHKKIHFLLFIGSPFIAIFAGLIMLELNFIGYLFVLLCLLGYASIVVIAFLKRGFVKINSRLYRASFFAGRLIFKTKIDISDTPNISILTFNKSQNLAWFSVAKPNLADASKVYEINILNDRHTHRKPILNLLCRKNAENAILYLSSNFELKDGIYQPDFS